ncbi:MAG TPA: hypothetical protein PLP19_12625 [bacterium]|nr:hypothetical protein [bacterium]HPN44329.1 hypothetical protein [bacterium]
MNVQLKSAIIILATLFIGMAIGALGMKQLYKPGRPRFADFRERDAFMHLHEDIIQPNSEAQRDSIHHVLTEFLPKFQKLTEQHRSDIRALVDSMQTQLEPILTKEQIRRLKERRNNMPPGPGAPPLGVRGPWPPQRMPPGAPPDSLRPRWPDRDRKPE